MPSELRTDSERDVDKFPYTYTFRRLGEITQVSSENHPILQHNRMTHSYKVAQVAARLAQYLKMDSTNAENIRAAGGIDANTALAAGLAHDMGHPPFGHIGEEVLDQIALKEDLDGYEGNAQTFRIITRLLVHSSTKEPGATPETLFGMNLTDRAVAATVKYPWKRHGRPGSKTFKKFGYYKDDRDCFRRIVQPFIDRNRGNSTLEAQIMDWADDITYATHDIEDYYTSGLIPLERLRQTYERNQFWSYAESRMTKYSRQPSEVIREKFDDYAKLFPTRPFGNTLQERAYLGRLISRIITDSTQSCKINAEGKLDRGDDGANDSTIGVLKQLTWYYVIDTPELRTLQIGQKERLRAVTEALIEWVVFANRTRDRPRSKQRLGTNERWANRKELPPILNELALRSSKVTDPLLDDDRKMRKDLVRATLDFVAMQTEGEIDRLYGRLVQGQRR